MAVVLDSVKAIADDRSPTPSAAAPKPPPTWRSGSRMISNAVLENHIDPPARQHMILSGDQSPLPNGRQAGPAGLGSRVSAVATTDQLVTLLADAWPKTTAKPVAARTLEEALFNGLLAVVPGGAELMRAKDRKVMEQIEGNRYVGIHVSIAMDNEEKEAVLGTILKGGPADRAGAKANDLIEEIDGVPTRGMLLRDVVDRLRGEEGTDVTIKVRQPKETKSRTLTITRGVLPHVTIQGTRKRPDGAWDLRFEGLPDPIGYLNVVEIAASTPHELRKLAQQLETQGARALILDLRGIDRPTLVHPAVLLADCFLDHGPIGRVRTARGETTYQADSDALFRGWPMVVLVDFSTTGTAEWLAAALQDNHRATIVGLPTHLARRGGATFDPMHHEASGVRSRVSVGDGSWSIELTTGSLVRGDGRTLCRSNESAADTHREIRLQPAKPDAIAIETGVKPDHPIVVNPGRSMRARSQAKASAKAREKTASVPPQR